MVANELSKRVNAQTIATISQKGGAGKTTIGIHLALAAVRRGMHTALFDLDPRASASTWADKRCDPSPADVSAQAARAKNGDIAQIGVDSCDVRFTPGLLIVVKLRDSWHRLMVVRRD
jgi:cellulose biosynthesis protein BcsQ